MAQTVCSKCGCCQPTPVEDTSTDIQVRQVRDLVTSRAAVRDRKRSPSLYKLHNIVVQPWCFGLPTVIRHLQDNVSNDPINCRTLQANHNVSTDNARVYARLTAAYPVIEYLGRELRSAATNFVIAGGALVKALMGDIPSSQHADDIDVFIVNDSIPPTPMRDLILGFLKAFCSNPLLFRFVRFTRFENVINIEYDYRGTIEPWNVEFNVGGDVYSRGGKRLSVLPAGSDYASQFKVDPTTVSSQDYYNARVKFDAHERSLGYKVLGMQKIQLILREYTSLADVLYGFDIGCCEVGMHFGVPTVYLSYDALLAYSLNINVLDIDAMSATYEDRVDKYLGRGFHFVMPDIDIKDIVPGYRQLGSGGSLHVMRCGGNAVCDVDAPYRNNVIQGRFTSDPAATGYSPQDADGLSTMGINIRNLYNLQRSCAGIGEYIPIVQTGSPDAIFNGTLPNTWLATLHEVWAPERAAIAAKKYTDKFDHNKSKYIYASTPIIYQYCIRDCISIDNLLKQEVVMIIGTATAAYPLKVVRVPAGMPINARFNPLGLTLQSWWYVGDQNSTRVTA